MLPPDAPAAPPPRGGRKQRPGKAGSALALVLGALLAGVVLLVSPSPVLAQSVALSGMLGNRALLIVNGGAPKSVAPGDSFQGVKVVSTAGDQAVVEIEGKRLTLRLGDSPVTVGGGGPTAGGGTRIVLHSSGGGHFVTEGQLNGKPVQFVVDTGATSVSIGVNDADRLGLNYRNGERVGIMTANGQSTAYRITLDSIRIGDVQVFGVQAIVLQQSMPVVLLGNSYLSRFSMRREADQLVLERRF